MIKLNQMNKLQASFKRLSDEPKFRDLLQKANPENAIGLLVSNEGKTTESFSILEQDKAKLTISLDLRLIGDKKASVAMASALSAAINEISSKNVKAKVYSLYEAPSKVEQAFTKLRSKVGQEKAMKACVGMTLSDGSNFDWRQASLKGFVFDATLYQDLHSFDVSQIQRQKSQMSKDLRMNIEYQINKILPQIGQAFTENKGHVDRIEMQGIA